MLRPARTRPASVCLAGHSDLTDSRDRLAACASGGAPTSNGGSATSGTVNWWGWSPSAQAAKADIAAFNKVYPHIKVNYKLLPVTGVAAAMRPASGLRSPRTGRLRRHARPELTSWGGFALDLTLRGGEGARA